MRGYYSFAPAQVASVLRHLLEQAHITIEDRESVEQALSNCWAGIDFADALHHASYRSCASVASFDDRKFARRARKLGLATAGPGLPLREHHDCRCQTQLLCTPCEFAVVE